MTKAQHHNARAILGAYYANSVSGSVLATPTQSLQPPRKSIELAAERQALLGERAALRATIDTAYWRFTRQARALPPSLQCPKTYARLREVELLLRDS